MENRNRDTAHGASHYGIEEDEARILASANYDDPKDEEEDEEENDEGDWGHIDPAEGNSPFPDSNDPSGPGSAV